MSEAALTVIALVSGGKDSFYSILHCIANGHRVVALGNLHPPTPTPLPSPRRGGHKTATTLDDSTSTITTRIPPHSGRTQQHGPPEEADYALLRDDGNKDNDGCEVDLNSFMYQTVGHQIIPLYATATGLPLFRQPILGSAVHQGIDYSHRRDPRHARLGGSQSTIIDATDSVVGAEPVPRKSRSSTSSARADDRSDVAVLTSRTPDRQQNQDYAGQSPEHLLDQNREVWEEDETESLVPLLRAVLKAHPEANALCTGAILSTYQRTRVESVALRLGLVPLAYLWQFTELPAPSPHPLTRSESRSYATSGGSSVSVTSVQGPIGATGKPASVRSSSMRGRERHTRRNRRKHHRDDAQLLRDMASIGLEARIVKVASAGLDEEFLWENVASEAGLRRIERAMRRFGSVGSRGTVLGEGGEFETLVLDGPEMLFKGRIIVPDKARRMVHEGGGCAWLSFLEGEETAVVEMKDAGGRIAARADDVPGSNVGDGHVIADESDDVDIATVPIPGLLDLRFEEVLHFLREKAKRQSLVFDNTPTSSSDTEPRQLCLLGAKRSTLRYARNERREWRFFGETERQDDAEDDEASHSVKPQTTRIVGEIRQKLQKCSLSANAITNSIIILRRMSDFPVVNELYGSLFNEPNPPARVTISCGDLLPKHTRIAVYLSVSTSLEAVDRRGLHVQSRSYWAPANIGPYSQAIAYPMIRATTRRKSIESHDNGEEGGEQEHEEGLFNNIAFLAVSIAGQIPLLPASMTLPSSSEPHNLELQIALALQHLWRVGVEMQVQWWSSAVAYFPRGPSPGGDQNEIRVKALLAADAWRSAHLWSETDKDDGHSDEDDDTGPDLWDRKYNPQYMSFVSSEDDGGATSRPGLPNWDVVSKTGVDADKADTGTATSAIDRRRAKEALVPFVFAAEVEELPRQAGVEWHAHMGFAKVTADSVQLFSQTSTSEDLGTASCSSVELRHVIVSSPGDGSRFCQTTAALVLEQTAAQTESGGGGGAGGGRATTLASLEDLVNRITELAFDSLGKVLSRQEPAALAPSDVVSRPRPKITYLDRCTSSISLGNVPLAAGEVGAFIPCRSLWDARGRRLLTVSIYETVLEKAHVHDVVT